MIDDQTQLNLVIGYPLPHTKSPCLHNAIYQKLNINAVMLAHRSSSIKDIFIALKTFSVGLTAVTMPFKESIIPYLDELSAEANALKAVNTVIQRHGKCIGYNTDVAGIAYALKHTPLKEKSVLIIGAGGAARALGYYLHQQGATLHWLNRTKARAASLISDFGGCLITHDALHTVSFDLIVNTTPLGSSLYQETTPLPHFHFHSGQTVFDMVYYPRMTRFLNEAHQAGAKIIHGLSMFLGQGIKQEEHWLNLSLTSDNLLNDLAQFLEAS